MTPTKAELDAAWIAACKAWTFAHKAGWTTAAREKYKTSLAEYNRLANEARAANLPIDKPLGEE